jgi:hypothetical protein
MSRGLVGRVGAGLAAVLLVFWFGKRAGLIEGAREERVAAWQQADSAHQDSITALGAALSDLIADRRSDSVTAAAATAARVRTELALARAQALVTVVAPDSVVVRDTVRAVPPELLERLSATETALAASRVEVVARSAEARSEGLLRLNAEASRDQWQARYGALLVLGKDLEARAYARGIRTGRTQVLAGVGAMVVAGAAVALYTGRQLPPVQITVARVAF